MELQLLGCRLTSGNVEEWLWVLAGSLLLGSVKSGRTAHLKGTSIPACHFQKPKCQQGQDRYRAASMVWRSASTAG